MLLCKFVLGEHAKDYGMQTDKELRLPPLKPGSAGVRYDSVRGGPHSGNTMHIVYSNDRVYPEYLATYYKRAPNAPNLLPFLTTPVYRRGDLVAFFARMPRKQR
jgi:hypothetical protein